MEENRNLVESNASKLRKKQYYNLPGSKTKWKVVKSQRVEEDFYILARNEEEYAVFSFWLGAQDLNKHFPADKFTYGSKAGEHLFQEIINNRCAKNSI